MTYYARYYRGMEKTINKEELKFRIDSLPDFVLKKVDKVVTEYEKDRDEDVHITFETCPKCGIAHPRIIKGGKTAGGKQMFQCKECGARFVADYNEVTFYSRLSKEQWDEAIRSSISGDSLDVTASKCDVSHRTAFNMRHKIMSFLEKNEDSIQVAEEVELDEKYLQESHKGKKIEGKPSRHRGEKASKRGISDEKVCLLTAVERKGESFLRSYNMGRPSSEEVMNLKEHIKQGSYLWTDALASYNDLTKELGSKRVILSTHEEYDKVNHLNTVNSFHSLIGQWYRFMRGVATKYINRYAALYNIRWLCRGMDDSESLMKARKRIKSLGQFASLDWDEVDNTRLYEGRGFVCA